MSVDKMPAMLWASWDGSAAKARPSRFSAFTTSLTRVPALRVICFLSRSLLTTPAYLSSGTRVPSVTTPLLNECPAPNSRRLREAFTSSTISSSLVGAASLAGLYLYRRPQLRKVPRRTRASSHV